VGGCLLARAVCVWLGLCAVNSMAVGLCSCCLFGGGLVWSAPLAFAVALLVGFIFVIGVLQGVCLMPDKPCDADPPWTVAVGGCLPFKDPRFRGVVFSRFVVWGSLTRRVRGRLLPVPVAFLPQILSTAVLKFAVTSD
jgi:hypothetical protein